MLEEVLNSGDFPPHEVANALLSFLRDELPNGGSAAEVRLFRLFPQICVRVFGELKNENSSVMNPTASGSGVSEYSPGGWLSKQKRWYKTNQRSNVTSSSSHVNSYDMDPVVKLLASYVGKAGASNHNRQKQHRQPTLIDVISTETAQHPSILFAFPLTAFPTDVQHIFSNTMENAKRGIQEATNVAPNFFAIAAQNKNNVNHGTSSSDMNMLFAGSENSIKLSNLLLGYSYHDFDNIPSTNVAQDILQRILVSEKTGNNYNTISSSPGGAGSSSFMSDNKKNPPNTSTIVMLSMLEYYLVSFVKFSLSAGQTSSYKTRSSNANVPEKYNPLTYNHKTKTNNSMSSSSKTLSGAVTRRNVQVERYGEKIYLHLFQSYYLDRFFPHLFYRREVPRVLNRDAELFLCIMISFWLEGMNTLIPTTVLLGRLVQNPADIEISLDRMSDLTQLKDENTSSSSSNSSFKSVPLLVQKSIYSLICHMVRNPAVKLLAQEESRRNGWCLLPEMTTIQPFFYNYIRMTFKYAPLHYSGSPFFTALDAWLVYLEPWNVNMTKSKFLSSSSGNSYVDAGKQAFQQMIDSAASSVVSGVVNSNGLYSSSSNSRSNSGNTNTNHGGGGGAPNNLAIPKPSAASKFTAEWESYVAANLHLYIVPLAIFLKRSREIDFSSDFNKNLDLVQRVIRVFSPRLVKFIHTLTKSEGLDDVIPSPDNHGTNTIEPQAESVGGERDASTATYVSRDIEYMRMLKKNHEENLGVHSPYPQSFTNNSINMRYAESSPLRQHQPQKRPPHNFHLSQCSDDAKNLLEEIHFHIRKKKREKDVVDRAISKIGGVLFGVGLEGHLTTLEKITDQFKSMSVLDNSYEGSSSPSRSSASVNYSSSRSSMNNNTTSQNNASSARSMQGYSLERDTDGNLTERGLDQILSGRAKLSSLEIARVASKRKSDPHKDRIKSYEIPVLVTIFNKLSDYLNATIIDRKKILAELNSGDQGGEQKRVEDSKKFRLFCAVVKMFVSRFNLRFMADYRNLLWFGIALFLGWKSIV